MSKSGMPNIQYPELGGTAPPMEEMKMDQAPYPPPPPYNESYQSQSVPMLQPQPITTTTIVQTVNMTFPPNAIRMKCFYCNEEITTRVQAKATCISWLFCTVLCFLGCFCGCCLIPFCTNGTRDMVHTCPRCGKYLGIYERTRLRK